jgi:CRP/FNR family transcriptional regulator, cyclic AMP receptor protein
MSIGLFKNAKNTVSFAAGETIFAAGDAPGGLMYVVQSGEVTILVNGEALEMIGPGSPLGELGLVDNAPRSATAVAHTDCILVPIDEKQFNFLVQQTPNFALQIMRTMAARLRAYREY